ncbi:hypothetical protein M5G07_05780 [Serratia symbiotica]|nr:hypothetical protein [Serratia symbiotica]
MIGWPIILFLIAECLRNLGRYTFADVVSYRLKQKPIRTLSACGFPGGSGAISDRTDGRRWQANSVTIRASLPCGGNSGCPSHGAYMCC